ncbi:MAG: periplasmic heavy metal sensor [Pseudomonadota bacterium]
MVMLVITVCAAAFAGWAGVQYGIRHARQDVDLDATLHRKLALSPEQEGRIHSLEQQFGPERKQLQSEMRASNRDLAQAIMRTHTYGPEAQGAIERSHHSMGALQEATVKHVLAMRAVLTAQQGAIFDRTIAKALASDVP